MFKEENKDNDAMNDDNHEKTNTLYRPSRNLDI